MGRTSNAKERLMDAVAELIWTGSYGSTTIDDICEKAEVKKGSFYYFFESKAELAAEALDAEWKKHRVELDAIFSPLVPPLERFQKLAEFEYQHQKEAKERFGRVLGCPLFSLGAEISTQESALRKKISEVLDDHRKYFISAIRDAHAAGLIHAPDPEAKARIVFSYGEGLLTEARIRNDLEILREMASGTFQLLGVKEARKKAA